MRPEETIEFHIRWAWAKISRIYNAEAAKEDWTMSSASILLNIDKEGTPSTSLGPRMGMESRSLTRSLKTMEERGLIIRKPDKVDKRMVRVFLTKKGTKMREKARNAVVHFNSSIKEKIGQEKLNTFFEVMGDLNTILDKNEIFKEA